MNISVVSFKFTDFRQIPLGRGLYVSPDQVIHASGRRWTNDAWAKVDETAWRLALCPDDHADSNGGEVKLSFRVDKEESDTGDEIEIDTQSEASIFTVILRDASESVYREVSVESSDDRFYVKRFVERCVVVKEENNILRGANGSLHVDLIIQPKPLVTYSQVLSPNMLVNNMLALLDGMQFVDVFFKFPDTIRCAHRFVLRVMAPDLECLCIKEDQNKICGVVIENTSVDVFSYFLRYLYGAGLPSEEFLRGNGMELIDLANMYGVSSLKVEVETFLVTSNVINVTNVVDYFLFADAKDCALLKESALAVFLSRAKDIIDSEHFRDMLAKSPKLMTELLKSSIDNGRVPTSNDAENHDLRTLSVIALRHKLQQKGLNMDGSKEMLILRLEASDVDVVSANGESESGSEEYELIGGAD